MNEHEPVCAYCSLPVYEIGAYGWVCVKCNSTVGKLREPTP